MRSEWAGGGYKRKATWWIDFTSPSGERIRTSARTGDRHQAQELHDKLKAEAWRVAKLGEKPPRTWDQAALKWLEETAHKATHEEDKAKLRWLHPHLTLKRLDAITRDVIGEIARKKAAEVRGHGKPLPCPDSCDPAPRVQRMGVDRQGSQGLALLREQAAGALDHAGTGAQAA